MRLMSSLILGFSLLALPASAAEPVDCTKLPQATAQTQQLALQQLTPNLKGGLSGAQGDDVIKAFEQAATTHPDMTGTLATMVAAGRPDLLEPLRRSVTAFCPTGAAAIMQAAEAAATSPSLEQTAALAAAEGAGTAAGGTAGDGSNGSSE